ncbi:hypothetical protein Daus18300_002097 [Diaporthe australafricana]|uniref:Uncharacterized protein n=1 Tax=Diaporthe australafricana TaxID=127596 RepID=A0ABR3XR20_9PEZI
MVGFLDLPVELRDQILLEVILDTIQQPPEAPVSVKNNEAYRLVEDDSGFMASYSVGYFCKALQRHALPLLHINQQTRDEVIGVVSRRLGQRVDDAKLDVMDIKNEGTWATWLSAPFPFTHLNVLHVQLRMFDVPLLDQTPEGYLGDNDPDAEGLCDLLACFLGALAGRSLLLENPEPSAGYGWRRGHHWVESLSIDIPFNSEPDPRYSLETFMQHAMDPNFKSTDEHYHCVVPSTQDIATAFAEFLHRYLLRIFDGEPQRRRNFHFHDIVYERIGKINISVGGTPFRSLDLSQILAELPPNENWFWAMLSRENYFFWKRMVEDTRETLGFRVVSPSIQEHELEGSLELIVGLLAAGNERLLDDIRDDEFPDEFPPPGEPDNREIVAFTGQAVLIQEDGTKILGNANFYWKTDHIYYDDEEDIVRTGRSRGPFGTLPACYRMADLEKKSENGEAELFSGEAIVIGTSTIVSGDATFYGRAEDKTMNRLSSLGASGCSW